MLEAREINDTRILRVNNSLQKEIKDLSNFYLAFDYTEDYGKATNYAIKDVQNKYNCLLI